MLITVDAHERPCGMPNMLRKYGAQVDVRSLSRGDYIVGPSSLVERKTVADLHGSIDSGRFWQQIQKIRTVQWPYLLIEGTSLFAGPVGANALRGLCVAVTDLGVTIVRTEDTEDTASWLFRIATRRYGTAIRQRPAYAQRPKSTVTPAAEAALACASGVSVETARTVLSRFGSLRAVGDASFDDLLALPGVGVKRASAIAALIHGSGHSVVPNGGRPAT